ncbi:MAG: peptidoglycan-binding protein [Actinomycetes bacterium]
MSFTDFSFGDTGEVIHSLTTTLTRLGFLTAATTNFDREVERAIKAFQQERGLIVTGVINHITFRALDEAHWKLGDRILRFTPGSLMRGDDIALLQSRLVEMGFNAGRVDGIYGVLTESAVSEFQKSVGVKVDGSCGPATVIALMRLLKTVTGGAPTQLRDDAARAVRGPALANKVIVIDPGSDNFDSEIIFDIAQRLEGRLIALGVTVLLTNSPGARSIESDRINLANSVGADLMISLRLDRYKNEKAHGLATYYYGSDVHKVHSVVGERFANLLQREICSRTDLLNCRTHAKTWDLLRLTKAPTVRIDLGYISNPGDLQRLEDPSFRETVVESLIVAVQRLYLSAENDAKTGTLRISDLRNAGIRL